MKLLTCVLIAAGGLHVWGQTLPLEPAHDAGASVTGTFEGWFKNPDGSFSFLLGYYNRNRAEEVDIPVGVNNAIEPGGPDRGQPTHFVPGRAWGAFTVRVPANFGENKLKWTLTVNGKTTAIPLSLHPDYEISPLLEVSAGNTPPVVRFEEHGPSVQGPGDLRVERKAKVGEPLPLPVWVSDDEKYVSNAGGRPRPGTPPVTMRWLLYRGPAPVAFAPERLAAEPVPSGGESAGFQGKATAAATFREPGDYILYLVVNDFSGDGGRGFQCCWTNAFVNVTVSAR